MLASFSEILSGAAPGTAIGAFTCYDVETATGVLRAAEDRDVAVVLLISSNMFAAQEGRYLVAGLLAMADQPSIPVSLQLDHETDMGAIQHAFQQGVGAALADGSRLSYAANVEFVRRAVDIAQRYGAYVEAELGRVEGSEDVSGVYISPGAFTDPEQAHEFIRTTGASCLAVSIGNIHGTYRMPPSLDWERLQSIRAQTSVPLALHGASGLRPADLRRAVALGIRKVNVNTELREAYLAATLEASESVHFRRDLLALHRAQAAAVTEAVAAKIDVIRSASRAMPTGDAHH